MRRSTKEREAWKRGGKTRFSQSTWHWEPTSPPDYMTYNSQKSTWPEVLEVRGQDWGHVGWGPSCCTIPWWKEEENGKREPEIQTPAPSSSIVFISSFARTECHGSSPFPKVHITGLERRLSSKEYSLLLRRTQVQFLPPLTDNSQLPAASALGELMILASKGTCTHPPCNNVVLRIVLGMTHLNHRTYIQAQEMPQLARSRQEQGEDYKTEQDLPIP